MRVLMIVSGSRGDVQPALALANGLRAAGHAVTLATPPNFGQWVESWGFRWIGFGPDMEEAVRRFKNPLEILKSIRDATRAQFDLIDAARASDLLVGAGLVLAGSGLGEAAGIPYVYAPFSPQFLPSRFHWPPVFGSPQPRWLNRFHWWHVRMAWNVAFRSPIDAGRAALGLGSARDTWTELVGAHPLLAADEALAPLPQDLATKVFQSGAWMLPEREEIDPDLEAFLSAGPPPVYIGFGSMTDAHPARTTALIVRAVEAAGVRALLSSGWANLGGETLPPHIRAIGPTPHGKLFPRCAAVVHHGGAGTTTAAARAGVPQIVVPHMFDQLHWALCAQAVGVALEPVPRRKLTAARLEQALRRTLSDDALRRNARALPARLTRDGVARAVRHLEALFAPRA